MKFPSLICRGVLIITPLGCGAQTLYDFGNPTADEQMYIELMNRARNDPSGEGERLATTTDPAVQFAIEYAKVNLTTLRNEFNALTPLMPPLAPNAKLMAIARQHSGWMRDNGMQSHTQPNNPGWVTYANRLATIGYAHNGAADNVYAYAMSPWHGHAGFEIDWRDDDSGLNGGMQNPRGHRDNIHDLTPIYREIGVGVTYGGINSVGPSQVTQNFAVPSPVVTFATGVAYYDLNSNNFYDVGEGISGLTVNVNGMSNYCITATGGGWVVPVTSGVVTHTIVFSGLNVNETRTLAFSNTANRKRDLVLTYTPPAISSNATANVGTQKTIAFPAVGGATGYKWHRWTTAAAVTEPADNTNNVNVTNSQMLGDSMLNSSVRDGASGASFWLANYLQNPGTRWIELSRLYRAGSSPAMTFRSRLLSASGDDIHKVQVKEEGSVVWTDVYTQNGTGNGGSVESGFNTRTANIASFANKTFRVRFILDFVGGNLLGGTPTNSKGWFIDNISFTNVQQLENDAPLDLATNTGNYTPSSTGTFLQAIAPVIGGREFPGAYQTLTVAAALPPTFATWASNLETANSLPAGTLAPPNGDYDKDGRVNLLEYAFGTSPITASEAAPRWPKIYSSTPTSLVMEYQVDTTLTDITVTPQASLTLGNWKTPTDGDKPPGFTDTVFSNSGNIQTRHATLPLSAGQKGFMRVKATQN